MEEKKFKLILVNDKNEIVGAYDKFEKREDLYIYLGLLINKSLYSITINYLFYFNNEFDTFEKWRDFAFNNANILCEFTENRRKYQIKIKEM